MIVKRRATTFIILLLLSQLLTAQSREVSFLIDTTITLMKQNAVNGNGVDWELTRKNAMGMAAGINNPYQLGPVMRYLFKSINDFHGAFFYKDSTFQWRHREIKVSDSIMNEWKKRSGIKTMLLGTDIGYLRIPSMPVASQEDFYKKAQSLNDSLCYLLEKNIKGIILDLRIDGGGAMHPMILGVEQLLSPGNVGSFRTKKKEDWFIRDNGFYVDTLLISKINPRCNFRAQEMPVVMLISPVTGSAAECLIIAFMGRKNFVLLGSETAGFVTSNAGFPINDTAFINLSIGYSADKAGRVYREAIKPDIPFVSPERFNDIPNDEKVKAAVKWLKGY